MRAVASIGIALAAALPAGCSTATCTPGTIATKVFLAAPINEDADHVVVTATDPPGLDAEVTANGTPGTAGSVSVALAFPHGYKPNIFVTLRARAYAGPVLLGEGQVGIRTSDKCSDSTLYIIPLSKLPLPDPDAGI